MRKTTLKPQVMPENVHERDLIEVTWKTGEMVSSRIAEVHIIQAWRETVEYRTKDGYVIFTSVGYGKTEPENIEVRVLHRVINQPTLDIAV